jgi:hypothetical protein
MRKLNRVVVAVYFGVAAASTASVQSHNQPGLGLWWVMLVVEDSGSREQIALEGATRLSGCTQSLNNAAGEIEKADGYVWHNKDLGFTNLGHEGPGLGETKVRVVELRCVYGENPPHGLRR